MEFRKARLSDAAAIHRLILDLSEDFFEYPDRRGAEPFLESISQTALSGYLQAPRYCYWLALNSDQELQGLIALRDATHLFHLFVAKQSQGSGLASQLWRLAAAYSAQQSAGATMTVNASLNALAVYQHWGFQAQGEVQHMHGIRFLPMILQRNPASSTDRAQV